MDKFDMQLTKRMAIQYRKVIKKEKGQILNEYCKLTAVKRNTAVKRLSRVKVLPKIPAIQKIYRQRGPKRKFLSVHKEIIKQCWSLSGKICAERLQPMLADYLLQLKQANKLIRYQDFDCQRVASISVPSLSRIIKAFPDYKKQIRYKHHGFSALYKYIPINARFGQQMKTSGYFETDFVCHNGGRCSGRHAITGVYVDVYCQWLTRSAGWGRNMQSVRIVHEIAQTRIFHPIYEFHPDNEPSILSLLFTQLQDQSITSPYRISRSRPYQKNDNAHVEQKNGDKVRRLVGYHRYDNIKQVILLNAIYQIADLYDNFFIPSAKLVTKYQSSRGQVVKRGHDTPQTPYQRILNDKSVSKLVKDKLTKVYLSLSMVKLKDDMERLIKKLDETMR